jgi:hypothetical protein
MMNRLQAGQICQNTYQVPGGTVWLIGVGFQFSKKAVWQCGHFIDPVYRFPIIGLLQTHQRKDREIGFGREPNRAEEGGDRQMPEKSLKMRHFQAFALLEKPRGGPSCPAGIPAINCTRAIDKLSRGRFHYLIACGT